MHPNEQFLVILFKEHTILYKYVAVSKNSRSSTNFVKNGTILYIFAEKVHPAATVLGVTGAKCSRYELATTASSL